MKIACFWLFAFLLITACSGGEVKKDIASTEEKKPETASTAAAEKKDAKETAQKDDGKVVCKTKGDERVIENVKAGEGCEVKYTKFGSTNVIASSASGTDHCEAVSGKVQSNLEKAGFTCT